MIQGFHRPATIAEAVRMSVDLPGAAYLGGGSELNRLESTARPEHLVCLDRLGLNQVSTEDGLLIGACCTIQQLVDAPAVPDALRAACRNIANRNIRVQATLGGQLGANRTDSDVIPVLVALSAELQIAAPQGTSNVAIDAYLAAPGGLITHISIPEASLGRSVAIQCSKRTANDRSVITAAASIDADGEPIVAMGGVGPHVTRLRFLEESLRKETLSDEQIERLVSAEVTTTDDIRGSARYKRHLAGVLAAKAVQEATEGAKASKAVR